MISRIVIRAEAKRDLRAARTWYCSISRELAEDFIREVDDAIARAQEWPLAFPIAHRSFRRVLLHRFPYALFYHLSVDRITVVAVLHQARDVRALESRRA